MEPRSFEALNDRLERLERECRRWRRAGTVAFFGALTMIATGATSQSAREVELERLVIRDEKDGRGTITLSAGGGHPSLSFSTGGQEKIVLAIPEGGSPTLSFVDGGADRLMLGLGSNGTPVLNFLDENQRRRISMGIFPKVGPTISLMDESNKIISSMPK